METYEDTLQGTGFIPGWPGTWSHGTRIIRDSLTGEIVDVLPPASVEPAQPQEEQAPQEKVQAPPEAIAVTETIAAPESEAVQ